MGDEIIQTHTMREYVRYAFLGLIALVLIVWAFLYLTRDQTADMLRETGFQSQNISNLPPPSEATSLQIQTSIINEGTPSDEK